MMWRGMLCAQEVYRVGCFFFQAEDGIRDLVRSRGLGDVYKRQILRAGDRERVLTGHEPKTTNNRMELQAAISALQALSLIHI